MSIEQQLVNRIDIVKALCRLTAEQRAAVVLHYWGNETCKDMAVTLSWEKWKPKKRIYEALCTIRTLWGVYLDDPPGDIADSWWPLLVESLRRHVDGGGPIGPDA